MSQKRGDILNTLKHIGRSLVEVRVELPELSATCFSATMHNMRLLCLLVAIAQVARSQNSVDEAIENVFGRGNGSLLRDYEVLTKAPLESLGSVEKCGEGSDQGVHRCVPYYDCDPVNNVVNEVDPPENGFGLLDIR